jgi:hypothetical protein
MQQGSFGDGTQANKNTPVYTVGALGLPLTAASLISSGHLHSCAVIGSTNLQCRAITSTGIFVTTVVQHKHLASIM